MLDICSSSADTGAGMQAGLAVPEQIRACTLTTFAVLRTYSAQCDCLQLCTSALTSSRGAPSLVSSMCTAVKVEYLPTAVVDYRESYESLVNDLTGNRRSLEQCALNVPPNQQRLQLPNCRAGRNQ